MVIFRAALLAICLCVIVVVFVPAHLLLARIVPGYRGVIPRIACRLLCRVLRVRVKVQGTPSPLRPVLFVANHVSWADILVLGAVQHMCFLAKTEVGRWPIIGHLARAQGAVFVDRNRKRLIPLVNANLANVLASGAPVVLFAESTTSDGTRLLRFRSSHFEALKAASLDPNQRTAAWVQPVALAYARRDGLTLGRSGRADLAWYGATDLLPHILSLLRSGPIDCRLVFGAPRPVTREESRKPVARWTENQVRVLFRQACQ